MTLEQLVAKKDNIIDQMVALNQTCVDETRSFTEDEQQRSVQLEQELENVKEEIRNAKEQLRNMGAVKNTKEEQKMATELTKEQLEVRAIEDFIKGNVTDEVRSVSTSASNTSIQPAYVYNEIVRRLEEVAPIFAKAQRYPAVGGELRIPREKADNLFDYGFVGENVNVAEKALTFDTVKLKSTRVGACVKVTQQLINDAGIDIVSYVLDLLARRLGATLDKHSITGTGSDDLQGLTTLTKSANGVYEVKASALTSDLLLDAVHSLHPTLLAGAEFVMNRKSYNAVAKLKDSDGNYILKLEKSVATGAPYYSAFGFPISINDSVADDKFLFVNIGEACASMVRKGAELKRISNDQSNALAGTHLFVVDAYVDFKLKNGQACVVGTIGE